MAAHAAGPDTRERVLDAAERLFRKYGYSKTTVEEISDEARTSRVTVYNHFKCKEEIAISWVARSNAVLCDKFATIAAGDEPAADRVRSLLMARVLERFDLVRDLTESIDDLLAAIRVPLAKERRRCHQVEIEILSKVVDEGRARNVFGLRKPEDTAGLLVIATNALLPYNLTAQQLGRRDEIERTAADLIDLLMLGCRTR